MPLVRAQYPSDQAAIVFIDDVSFDGQNVLSFSEFLALPHPRKEVVIAISDSQARERLAAKCRISGIGFCKVRAISAVELDRVKIGEGGILCGFTTLTSNIQIGRHFHANLYSYVAHDCLIGDFVTFAPNVHCNGNVHIGDHAYIGAGAILKQGRPDAPLHIGRSAIVGMGAVVTKNVPAGATVVGNPARIIASR